MILSIKPEYVTEIEARRKRFEFRKAIFKQKVGKVYIYASAPVSKVVGEFELVVKFSHTELFASAVGYDKVQDVPVEDISSLRRNPVLADVMAQLDYMEKRGSGLKKICNATKRWKRIKRVETRCSGRR